MEIIRKDEWITLPGGLNVRRPSSHDRKLATDLTKQQESLFNELCRLPATEEGGGRALSIQRQVARLERKKHPCLRIINSHLFPEENAEMPGFYLQ